MKSFFEKFETLGWAVIDFYDTIWVRHARSFLENELFKSFGKKCQLEEYHRFVQEDKLHTELQYQYTQLFRKERFGPEIIRTNMGIFKDFLGPDLWVQETPYLRIARPGCAQDNIGYHRDTYYGGSPYEISVLIPFVDLDEGSCLRVMSGSHVLSEDNFLTKQISEKETGVEKGSTKHQLGFLYAPKVMDDSIHEKMEPVSLKIGQALVFSLSTVHGCIVNKGKATRFSTDIRVMNALAPVDFSNRPNYYKSISQSPLTSSAQKYIEANKNEKAHA